MGERHTGWYVGRGFREGQEYSCGSSGCRSGRVKPPHVTKSSSQRRADMFGYAKISPHEQRKQALVRTNNTKEVSL